MVLDERGRRTFDGLGKAIYTIAESHPVPPKITRGEIDRLYPGCNLACRQCTCVETKLREQRLLRLGKSEMPDNVAMFSFDDFAQYPSAVYWAERLATGQPLIDADGNEKYGLLLSGPLGTGKTTLGSVVYLKRLEFERSAVWARYVSVMRRLTDTMDEGYAGPSISDILGDLMKAPFLMLDEVGDLDEVKKGVAASRFRNEHLLTIIDYRWAHHLPTIITTNLNIQQLYDYFDSAIISRMRGLCFAEILNGNDHRTGEKQR